MRKGSNKWNIFLASHSWMVRSPFFFGVLFVQRLFNICLMKDSDSSRKNGWNRCVARRGQALLIPPAVEAGDALALPAWLTVHPARN